MEEKRVEQTEVQAAEQSSEGKEVMRAGVVVHPKTGKQIAVFIMMLATIAISIVPVINIFNKPVLIFGMPLFMFWSLVILVCTLVVMRLAKRWEVY